MIGQTISHYRVIHKLGGGAMGVVYAAKDAKLGRMVALKFLPRGLSRDPRAVERFRREARAASALNHPNICTIYEIDEFEDQHFIAMEFLQGRTLKHCLTAKPLPIDHVVQLGLQLADALETAHASGIVHRDIKPANIFITDINHLKVLDFGLAKLMRPANEFSTTETLTEAKTIAGTLPYMAPEQLRGQKVDGRTDLYAFGTVLYEMATGRRPFREELPTQLIDDILHTSPTRPGSINTELSPKLEDTILKCLDKDPEKRYQSAKEVAVDLRRIIASSSIESRVSAPGRHFWWKAALGALAAVLLALLVSGSWQPRLTGHSESRRIKSLVVLPFDNLSGEADQEYFTDGIAEALIADLSHITALRVISRTSAMHYKGTKKTLPEIARELGLDAVLEGSVQRSGKRVRITAQLVYAPSDTSLWVGSYDREVQDVLWLESSVARSIAHEIQVKLTPEEAAQLTRARQIDPEAYELYLRGRYEWNKRTADGLKRGAELFEQSLAKDGSNALAYAGLADSYFALAYSVEVLSPREAVPKARAAALKALELDDRLAEAHATSGAINLFYDMDWAGAEQEFKRAIALNPGYATAHHWYGLELGWAGRVPEATAELQRAEQLDPLSAIISMNLAWTSYLAGDYQRAIDKLHQTLEIDRDFWATYWDLGECKLALGRSADAILDFRKAVDLSGGSTGAIAMLGYTYGIIGERVKARNVLYELKKMSQTRYVSPADLAMVEFGLGNKDRGFGLLKKAYEQRSRFMVTLKTEVSLDRWRSDPRFQDLLRRMNLSG